MPGPRPKVRPTAGLHNLGRGPANLDSQYVSTCKLCRCGIYKAQPHRWLRKPMGYSHTACIERESP